MSQAPLLSSNSTVTSRRPSRKTFRGKLKACTGRIASAWRKSLKATKSFLKHAWRGEVDEKPKIVRRQGILGAIKRCWPHFLTLSATAVLAWLNIAGFFVGNDFQGCATANCQTLDRLGLQVAAKIMRELLSQPKGLPLGLLISKQQFSQIQYLISPEFRFGLSGLSRVKLYVDCIWAGLSPITEVYKQAHYTAVGLSIRDGIVNRLFGLGYHGVDPETWASAPHLAVSLMSRNAGQIWFQALLRYPFLPEYDVRLDLSILQQASFPVSPHISTFWSNVPETARLTDNSTTTDMPSALLNILIPHNHSWNDARTLVTCSVDARWTKANYRGQAVDSFSGHYVQQAGWAHFQQYGHDLIGWQYSQRPVAGGSWRKVQIERDWLEALTPPMDNSTAGATTLANVFKEMGIDHNTNTTDIIPAYEAVVATMVTDGMSRTGFRSVGKAPDQLTEPLNLLPDDSVTHWGSLVGGRYNFPRPDGPATELKLSMTIGGYAYRADSKAYWLALAVLLSHAALVLAHLGYVLCTRVFSHAWESITSFIVLAAMSGTNLAANALVKVEGSTTTGGNAGPSKFENASSGVSRYRTMNTSVKIRAKSTITQNVHVTPTTAPSTVLSSAPSTAPAVQNIGEQIEMLFGQEDELTLEGKGYRRLEVGKVYG
ncbi:MAG: hypothetical protein Q9218_002889 [Villophora microphyllina]